MSKGAFPTQPYLGNFGNFNLPPMAFTNRFMPPKPNYQPLMKMPTQPDPRAGFMSIQQQPAPYIEPTPVQPAPQLPPIEPMVTPTQPLTTTPQPLAQAPSLLSTPQKPQPMRQRFIGSDRRIDLPPINLFR
jgi:hypothetical protein